MKTKQIDAAVFKEVIKQSPDGYLYGNVICTRSGVFEYLNESGELENRLRHPDDVFKMDSLKSLEMIPVTLDHPADFVNPENFKNLAVGFTGEKVQIDGEHIIIPIKVTDKKAIAAIRSGKSELSLGYEVELIDESGEYNSIPYTKRQTNIFYNHLAVVDNARAGHAAKIHLDHGREVTTTTKRTPKKKEGTMYKLSIDGLDHETDNVEIAKAFQKANDSLKSAAEKIASLDSKVSELSKSFETVTAERDAAIEKNKQLSEVDHKAEIKKAVDERLKLEREVVGILGDQDISGMDNLELVTAVVKKMVGDSIDLTDKSPEYIQTRFQIAMEDRKKTGDNKEKNTDAANHNTVDAAVFSAEQTKSIDDARAEMIKKKRGLK